MTKRPKSLRRSAPTGAAVLIGALLSGCGGAGGADSGSAAHSISVLMVNNPQMLDLERLTAADFTRSTGIKVYFTVSPVAGKMGYVPAPVDRTDSSGWLYSWAWGLQKASKHQSDAWKFISWASSKHYETLVGGTLGWSRVPAGKRASTYGNSRYLAAAGPFAKAAETAIDAADPALPGVQPRPAAGIQFVDIQEFETLGDQVSQQISSAIAGRTSVAQALRTSQTLAAKVGARY